MSARAEVASESPRIAREPRAGLELALLAAVVSGIAVYVNGEAVGRFPSPTVYTTGKNLIAGFVLIGVAMAAMRRPEPSFSTVCRSRHALAGLAVVAVIGGAVPFVLFFEGLAQATSSDAAFLHKTLVVWVALGAHLFLREQIGIVHVVAVAVLVGAQVALSDGIGSLRPGKGEAMILVATLCWSVELLVVKRLVESVPPAIVAASRIAGGAALLTVWLVLTGRLTALTSLSMSQWAWLVLTGSILSVFVSIWFAAVARAGVTDVAALLVLGAVITGAIDAFAGATVAPVVVVGWVLIVVAVVAVIAHWPFAERTRVVA